MSMTTHAPVVVGIDGSAEAIAATRYAAWEAERRGVALRLVYAYQPTPIWGQPPLSAADYDREQDRVRELLDTARKEVANTHPDLPVEAVGEYGYPAGALVAESTRASLVVVGTRATGGLHGHLAGSVAAQVAAHADAPVVVVRDTEPRYLDPVGFAGRPVVVGVDCSEESIAAFAFAVEQAVARDAELHAVLVWDLSHIHDAGPLSPDTFDTDVEGEKAERLLAEATAGWSEQYPDLVIVRRTVHDTDAVEVLAHAALTAGLLVVGSRGHGGFLGLRLGSTVDGLVRQSPVPVAVVRGSGHR